MLLCSPGCSQTNGDASASLDSSVGFPVCCHPGFPIALFVLRLLWFFGIFCVFIYFFFFTSVKSHYSFDRTGVGSEISILV